MAYTDNVVLCTEGSKADDGVGSAFVVQGTCSSRALPVSSSVYTAQLYVVWKALQYRGLRGPRRFAVLTHLTGFITTLGNTGIDDSLFNDILCTALEHQGVQFTFIRVPRQVGIKGNEDGDSVPRIVGNSPKLTSSL